MSTRCQLGVYKSQDTPLEKWEVLLYRHSDGYPGKEDGSENGVLPDIIPFLKRFDKERGITDLEYCGAWLMHHLIEEHVKWKRKFARDHPSFPPFPRNGPRNGSDGKDWLGHGICRDFHVDIEYFYKIYPGGVDVFEIKFGVSPDGWERIKRISLK